MKSSGVITEEVIDKPIQEKVETHDLKKIHLEGILKKTYIYSEEECLLAVQNCKDYFELFFIF
jgi:hypothetical protein